MTIYVAGPCGVCSLALPPPRCSLSFQPFIFHLLFLFPPWSLKAINFKHVGIQHLSCILKSLIGMNGIPLQQR